MALETATLATSYLMFRGHVGPADPVTVGYWVRVGQGNTFYRIDRIGCQLLTTGDRRRSDPYIPVLRSVTAQAPSVSRPCTRASTSDPYLSSFAAPIPEIDTRPAGSAG